MPTQQILTDTLANWCSTNGLYARQTFISLFGCLIRLLREQRMQGLVFAHTPDKTPFAGLTDSLAHLHDQLTFYAVPSTDALPGLLVILTDRLCTLLYWTEEAEATFQLVEGGWTFHPSDVRGAADHLFTLLPDVKARQRLQSTLTNTRIDRRFDERLTMLIPSLVNGLEQRNRELTLTLKRMQDLHERMVDTERLAAIGQLSAVLAHEIRNPLGIIDLYAKLAESSADQLQTQLTPEQQDSLKKPLSQIRLASAHLETFLSELTDFCKPFTISMSPVHVWNLVKQTVEFCQPLAQEQQVLLGVLEPSSSIKDNWLRLDAPRIQQALLNLIKNALEVSQPGKSITVTIASRKQDESLFVKVMDEGPGLSAQQQSSLFTPFFTTKPTGTGLGLARSQKILEAHEGGSVRLLASSAKGSTFSLVLPKTLLVKSQIGLTTHL